MEGLPERTAVAVGITSKLVTDYTIATIMDALVKHCPSATFVHIKDTG